MQATQEYVFKEIKFDADRSFKPGSDPGVPGGNPIDLKKLTAEVNLFEDINKGYVTATLVIIDDASIFSEVMELQGTEKITIRIAGAEDNKGQVIILQMRVVSIVQQAKVNDRASVFTLSAIQDHGYRDSLVKVSKSYTGQLEDSAEEILKSFLGITVQRDEKYYPSGEKSVQGDVKVLVPYISPLESTQWLMERASGKEGSPFFAWSSVWDNVFQEGNIRFGMLTQMLLKGYAEASSNKDRQWIYATGSVARDPTAKKQRRSITSFEQNNRENTLDMINQGTVGSRITNFDTYTSQTMEKHFDIKKLIEKMSENAPSASGMFSTIYDEENLIEVEGEKKPTGEHDARHRSLITSYGTYGWQQGYHDVFDPSLLINKVRKSSVLSMLNKNVLDVTITGHNVMGEKLSVGDVIKLTFNTQIVDDAGTKGKVKDERTSGYYLILKSRHIFTNNTHRVVMSCSKVLDS